jgi:hypothetical protein
MGATEANTYYKDKVYEKAHQKPKKLRRDDTSNPVYVHLIPHTHDDVGWLKTVDEYYVGSNQESQHAEVHLILTTVMDELRKNPSRKFTYVEMKFFTMWYERQTDEIKQELKKYVSEGRFEFVNGGWSMHDEATPHYEDMINNMAFGHEFLEKEFGVRPRVGWHVDPFGHSNANPRLFADMGFDSWLFARLDYEDKNERLASKSMNTLWRPFSKHFGKEKQIYTSMMKDHYCWFDGFYYDERFDNADPMVTDKRLDTFDADQKMDRFMSYVAELEDGYRGNHFMIPWGCDFTFANARLNFEDLDTIIKYINANNDQNVQLIYSTPGQYIDALHSQDIVWPTKYADMFPYADNPYDIWSGYYTSRQHAKQDVRNGQQALHDFSKIYSLAALH